MFRAHEDAASGDGVPIHRVMLWVVVWIGLLAGIVLYIKYARFLTPLLA